MIRLRKTISRTLTLLIAGMTASVGGAETSPIRPGDRIALVGNTFADQLRMHGYLETLLLQRSAGRPVSIRNLGWAGDMLTARDRPTNFPTEESTLRAHKADVIVACFGMGESFTGETGLAAFRNDLESFIASHKGKKYNGKSEVRLILISPITYEDLGSRTPNHERRNLELAAYVQTMNETSAKAGLPFINLYAPTSALMADSVTPKLTGNGVNLNAYGYWCVSRTMADRLLPGPAPWNLTVDAGSGKAEARGVAITGVKSTEHNLAFTVREETWPSLSAPVEGQIHRDLDSMRDTLSVKNLPAGAYRLDIDDQPAATASHEEWNFGVALNATPTHRELETYRAAINEKNQLFVYSWKALNQVHIVGERRKSASGRALPAEVMEFKKLADQMDKSLEGGIKLKTREWRLVRVKK
jgi:hypothetical protein